MTEIERAKERGERKIANKGEKGEKERKKERKSKETKQLCIELVLCCPGVTEVDDSNVGHM